MTTRDQLQQARIGVAFRRNVLAGTPIICDLVIIPLGKDRHLRIEGAYSLVKEIVFVVAAKLGQGLSRLGFLFRDDISSDLTIRQCLAGRNGAVGIDAVAGMDEEIGPGAQHGGIAAHPAARFIYAPALTRGVTRPDERHAGAPIARWGPKVSHLRFPDDRRG